MARRAPRRAKGDGLLVAEKRAEAADQKVRDLERQIRDMARMNILKESLTGSQLRQRRRA